MRNYRGYALVSLLPIKIFSQRLFTRWRDVAKKIVTLVGVRLGLLGSRIVGVTDSGNILLQLNRSYALGHKGKILELPRDQSIYECVKNYGSWEKDVSKFLALGLKKANMEPNTKIALIDIGANTGLVTLQAINLAKTEQEIFLFEPVPRHASALATNLSNLKNIHINNFALSDRNGIAEIFTEATNHGNTSLLKSAVPEIDMISTNIKLVETNTYCHQFLCNFEKYIIKSDTQGMDALILSRFPELIWKNCESAVIEVWALSEVSERDVDRLLSMLLDFEYISWQSKVEKNSRIELNEVSDFWLSKSGSIRNLFLIKNF
jgi:FkbM family methyltransferase